MKILVRLAVCLIIAILYGAVITGIDCYIESRETPLSTGTYDSGITVYRPGTSYDQNNALSKYNLRKKIGIKIQKEETASSPEHANLSGFTHEGRKHFIEGN